MLAEQRVAYSLRSTGGDDMSTILGAGARAPDFKLRVTPDQLLSLDELKGKRIVLAFYPADWSPVCGDQMALYNQVLPEFRSRGAEIFGMSSAMLCRWADFAIATILIHLGILRVVSNTSSTRSLVATFGS